MNGRRLRLALGPSPLLATAIVALHSTAAGCALLALPTLPGGLLALLLVTLGAHATWSRALLRARSSVRALEVDGPRATLVLAGGTTLAAEVSPRRHVSRLAVTLFLRIPARRTLLVTRDMLDEDSFRRLRVWALWGRLPPVAAKQLPA